MTSPSILMSEYTILLDFTAVFDTFDYTILLNILQSYGRVSEKALSWFGPGLSKQFVSNQSRVCSVVSLRVRSQVLDFSSYP